MQTKPNHEPNSTIKKYIESTRNIIGRFLAIQRGGKINKKTKRITGDKTTESVLRTHHMRLAAQSKKMLNKNATHIQFRNNIIFRNKQKQFYTKLRYGEENKLTNPPSTQDVNEF